MNASHWASVQGVSSSEISRFFRRGIRECLLYCNGRFYFLPIVKWMEFGRARTAMIYAGANNPGQLPIYTYSLIGTREGNPPFQRFCIGLHQGDWARLAYLRIHQSPHPSVTITCPANTVFLLFGESFLDTVCPSIPPVGNRSTAIWRDRGSCCTTSAESTFSGEGETCRQFHPWSGVKIRS